MGMGKPDIESVAWGSSQEATIAAKPGEAQKREPALLAAARSSRVSSWLTACLYGERPLVTLLFCAGYVMAIGLADVASPKEMTFGIFYLIPVVLSGWALGNAAGLAVSFFATVVWCAVDARVLGHGDHVLVAWNFFSRFAVYACVVLAVARVRLLQDGLQEMVENRTRQLKEEVAHRLEVQREITSVTDRERQRIGHELHDGLGQYLAGLAFRCKALEQSLSSQPALEQQRLYAKELTEMISNAIRQARLLARGLDPIELDNGDLMPAFEQLADEIQHTYSIACLFQSNTRSSVRVIDSVGMALYRICQEAVHNGVRHGGARNVRIQLSVADQVLRLCVLDDGKGFVPGPGRSAGMGLHIMKYRAEQIGGSLAITSVPGEGTQVICTLPPSCWQLPETAPE